MIDNNCLMYFALWQTGRLTKYVCTSFVTDSCLLHCQSRLWTPEWFKSVTHCIVLPPESNLINFRIYFNGSRQSNSNFIKNRTHFRYISAIDYVAILWAVVLTSFLVSRKWNWFGYRYAVTFCNLVLIYVTNLIDFNQSICRVIRAGYVSLCVSTSLRINLKFSVKKW